MPRIAFLLPNFRIGGAERVALSLIEEFLKRGIEVDLVLLRREGELLKLLPPDVHLVSLDAPRIRRAIRPLAEYLRNRRPDAVQARMWPVTIAAVVARWVAGSKCRVVISDHGILSHQYADRSPLHRCLLRASIALFYPRADARIAVSEGVARDLAWLGGLDPASINIVHNLVTRGPDKLGANFDWGGDGMRVLAVGSLKQAKNYPLLLKAFSRFSATRPARLLILGEGDMRPDLERLARELGIAEHVMMPGHAVDPAPYYASADIMALSSDREGYGNVLVEALHHGLTIVSTDCPSGPREILDGGRFGYLVPCGDVDALAEGLGKASDARLPAEPLVARAEELSGQHIIDQYLRLLVPGSLPLPARSDAAQGGPFQASA